ncbi:MAG: protein kinase [candidate division Zixibacteria bacterium]|nr:protein kinase [candidate division Zixibacteria bacterium]
MLKPGLQLKDYKILGTLGEGGMGVVYKALDTRLDRIVALKLISEKYSALEEYRKKLAREARNAARIDSSYVVKIWEYAEYEDTPYISYEYIQGNELREVMKSISFEQKLKYSRQIAEGLIAAHELGVVHRDLKPENIKITDTGCVKILDFGLAKTISADSVNPQGQIEGTLSYLSPEQVKGAGESIHSDMFSFGVVLYELFTGRKPFDGEYTAGIIYSILHEEPKSPSELDPGIPQGLNYIITRLLDKNPNERFRDMREVLNYLNDTRDDRPLTDEAVSYSGRRRNVIVIDLKNLSGDETWNYFCIGFSEDLRREISRRSDLVISSEPAGAAHPDIKDIFKRNRSDYVISGSLMKWDTKIKLSLSIYANKGETVIFGKNYEGEAGQLFDVLSESAEEISEVLARVTNSSVMSAGENLATDISAYDFYLRGKDYYETCKEKELKLASDMYFRALEIDPSFALAHTGLSDVYALQYNIYLDRSPKKIEEARLEAIKALELNPHLPEAHRSLGRYYMFTGNYEKAEKTFLKTLEINPKYAVGCRTIAWLKRIVGDLEQSLSWANKSLSLAPNDLETLLLISLLYRDMRKFTLAMATLQRTIEIGPDYGRAYYTLGSIYSKLGVFDLALDNFLLAIRHKGDPNSYNEAGYILLIFGDYEKAIIKFMESIESGHYPFIAYYHLGILEKIRGNVKEAFIYFNQALSSITRYVIQDPNNVHLLGYKALICAVLNRREEALVIIDKLLPEIIDSGEVLLSIARSYALLGDLESAGEINDIAINKVAGPTQKELAVDPHFKEMYNESKRNNS